MDLSHYANSRIETLLKELESSLSGLSRQESKKRLAKFGPNNILSREAGAWEIFLRQLRSPFIYLLLFAALLALVLGEYSNSLLILIFISINTILGFYQEYRSEQTTKLLKRHFTPMTRVLREGTESKILSEELVPGDLVVIMPGDIVSADIRLCRGKSLLMDESILTGESEPVQKTARETARPARELYQVKNMVFSGTTVLSGKGVGLVVATGRQTSLGKIAKITAETKRESVFEKEIKSFSQFVLRLVVLTTILMFGVNLLIKGSQAEIGGLTLFSIALAVSVVPEALPLVTTFSFSRGALRLAKKNVVVKRLSAVEDLGAIEVLCTDKTGTLTENQMRISEVYPSADKRVLFGAAIGSLADRSELIRNPFDTAIFEKISKEKNILDKIQNIENIPFDAQRRRDTTLTKVDGDFYLISRGAPETIIDLCHLNDSERKEIEHWVAARGEEGKRVLAIGQKTVKQLPEDLEKAEKDLELLGLISFVDPIKKTAKEAVLRAEKLGVAIKIISGDRKEVVHLVGEKIGLVRKNSEVVTGEEFERLPAKKQQQMIEKVKVFARVSPEQKYRIIQMLEAKHEVGFLGDGINDAPALKVANVALVVKGAADVAREAADIVLLKKDLKVIVDGIKEGREIFANTTKYITITLSANFGNFFAVAASSLLVNYLPMLPVQILLLNLLSDFPMIAIATDNVDHQDIVHLKSYNLKSAISLAVVLGLVSSLFDFMTFAIFSRLTAAVLQTSWFIESILSELVFIFSARTKGFFLKSKVPSLMLVALASLAAVATVALPMSVWGRRLFGFTQPNWQQMVIIFGIVLLYFVTTETAKAIYFKTNVNNNSLTKTRLKV